MFRVVENLSLAPLSSFRVGGTAHYYIECDDYADIPDIAKFAREKRFPLRIVGEGSNTIFGDGALPYCFLKLINSDTQLLQEDDTHAYVSIDAGVLWDQAVQWVVKHGLSGIEALSGIPGTCGAAPIQNIGAYGQEVKDTLTEVRVYDTEKDIFTSLSARACAFGYRTSVFKTTHKNRYIITGIVLKLSKCVPAIPNYPDVQMYFANARTINPSLQDIRNAILEIRASKLPDPLRNPNAGSFFKNPVVSKAKADALQKQYPTIKLFPISEHETKIPAGWLIEQCGFKGTAIGPVGIYEKNALVLTNLGNATYQDIINAKEKITRMVKEKFDIELEIEPEIIGG